MGLILVNSLCVALAFNLLPTLIHVVLSLPQDTHTHTHTHTKASYSFVGVYGTHSVRV